VRVGYGDVLSDGGLEGPDTGVHASAELALGQQREPAFHEIDPGGTGGCEVQMKAWALQEPSADHGRFMRPIVVEDEMHVQLRRDMGLNRVEELPKFSRPLSVMELPNDAACLDFQGGEERRRAMATIVMRPALDLSRAHRQQRTCAIQGLNLRLFIDAQDKRCIRRMEIQADNIAHLLDEQRIGRQLERLGPMRLQAKGPPDAMHGTAAHPVRLRHGAGAPMRRMGGCHLQGLGDNPFHRRIRHRTLRAGTGLIQQSFKSSGHKTLPPFADHLLRHAHVMGYGGIRLPFSTGQNNPGPLRQRLSGFGAARPPLQRLSFSHRQGQRSGRSSSAHEVLLSIPEDTTHNLFHELQRQDTRCAQTSYLPDTLFPLPAQQWPIWWVDCLMQQLLSCSIAQANVFPALLVLTPSPCAIVCSITCDTHPIDWRPLPIMWVKRSVVGIETGLLVFSVRHANGLRLMPAQKEFV
jgi:hypothetical protein